LSWLIKHLLNSEIRQETIGLQIGSTYFERMPSFEDSLLKDFLFGIFSSLNFWRNNTKNKIIPVAIMKQTHIFFATFMISHGPQKLI
tara:strand:- start:464 stop:724 length:261 start_codon:yes stop_codon:yes gene_type:complete